MTRLLLACSAVFLCIALAAHTTTAAPQTAAALQATNYIRTLQNTDGGFPDFGTDSTGSGTIEAILAFSATGIDPRTVTKSNNGPDDYLAARAATYSTTPGPAAKLVAGVAALDRDPASFGGVDVLGAMEANFDPATGKYGDDVFSESLFMLAERALGRAVPATAVTYLVSLQHADGGWEFCCGFGTDTNTTAIAVRALVAGGVPANDPALVSAAGFLKANQTSDGGFRFSAPFESDASSTAYAMQAIIALGQSAEAGGPWDLGGGANPLMKLASFQNAATGAVQAFGADNTFATYQSVPGLMLAAFPEQQNPDQYTATSTPTSTSTGTATRTPTVTQTSGTPSPTSTIRPDGTATPAAATSPTSVSTLAPTRVSTVLGTAAQPTHAVAVSALPSTGSGTTGGGDTVTAVALVTSGLFLLGAGAFAAHRRRAR